MAIIKCPHCQGNIGLSTGRAYGPGAAAIEMLATGEAPAGDYNVAPMTSPAGRVFAIDGSLVVMSVSAACAASVAAMPVFMTGAHWSVAAFIGALGAAGGWVVSLAWQAGAFDGMARQDDDDDDAEPLPRSAVTVPGRQVEFYHWPDGIAARDLRSFARAAINAVNEKGLFSEADVVGKTPIGGTRYDTIKDGLVREGYIEVRGRQGTAITDRGQRAFAQLLDTTPPG